MRQLERGIVLDGKERQMLELKFYQWIQIKEQGLSFNDSRRMEPSSEAYVWTVELPVMKLKRERVWILTLENLRPGDYRRIRSFEVKLRKLALDEKNGPLLGESYNKKNGLILLWVRFVI